MPITVQHNPFATRFTRPGAIPYLPNAGEDLEDLVWEFRNNGFVSQIVGQHGAGKTTLTLALVSFLTKHFHDIRRITIRNSSCVQSHGSSQRGGPNSPGQLLIVDGVERLSWLHRWLLIKQAQAGNFGLLITTHRPLKRVPVLYELRPSLATLEQITGSLAPGLSIDPQILKTVFEKNGGSIRESLMTLYNWYESQQTHTPLKPL